MRQDVNVEAIARAASASRIGQQPGRGRHEAGQMRLTILKLLASLFHRISEP